MLAELTQSLGVPRSVLASDDEIQSAWTSLPAVLTKIPPELRTEQLARACVAVGVGLFDSAINYVWNLSVVHLRGCIKTFGLNVVGQIVGKSFDEKSLNDLKDAELLDLALKLNLITEGGYFYLDQCRDIRNNFSAAHPSMGPVDEHEVIGFINRCAKHALSSEINPKGVDAQKFIKALKAGKFTSEQKQKWVERLSGTHEAQRELLLTTLHGIYCDPTASEESRVNSLTLCQEFVDDFTPKYKSALVDQHSEYLALGDSKRHKASAQFFERLGLLSLLSEPERHSMVTNACKLLMSAHQAYDNFYNEPPFAERLASLLSQGAVPDTAKQAMVEAVVTCGVGNQYGVSNAAWLYYRNMVKAFSPAEISLMLTLPGSSSIVGNRISAYQKCKSRFSQLVGLLDPSSIPAKNKSAYKKWSE